MALYCGRLCRKPVFATLRLPGLLNNAYFAQAAVARAPNISFQEAKPPMNEHYEEKNLRLNRPLSPHLTIYAVQLTSTMSITHRITGMALTAYASALSIGALIAPNQLSYYITALEGVNPGLLFVAKMCIAAPFGYHLVNGLRHLYWDTGKGLTIKEVYTSGYMVLGLTAALTVILAAL